MRKFRPKNNGKAIIHIHIVYSTLWIPSHPSSASTSCLSLHLPLCSQQYDACFVKVDIDEADDVALTYKVRSMPTFVFLRIVGDQIEEVRFSGCNKIKLEGLVKAMCAAVVKGEVRETKEEDKKKK